jgi:hypothetical protein
MSISIRHRHGQNRSRDRSTNGRSRPTRAIATCIAIAMPILVMGCGGDSDSTDDSPTATAVTATVATEPSPSGATDAATPVEAEACMEDSKLKVRNEDEADSFYTADDLDYLDLHTALLVEGGDTEYISGSISFYRTIATAEAQEVIFEESVTNYTVGRTGTVVYTLIGGTPDGELDTIVDTIDRCLAGD